MRIAFLLRKIMVRLSVTCILCCIFFNAGCACFSLSLVEKPQALDETVLSGNGKDKILLMDISGVLSSSEKDSLFSFQREARSERIAAAVLSTEMPYFSSSASSGPDSPKVSASPVRLTGTG